MERPQLEIDLEHQQLQRLLQENERQLELERMVQQRLPEAEENVQDLLKKQKNPIKDYTEEEQQALTKALSKKVAAKGHGSEAIFIAPYKDTHLIAYMNKRIIPPAHIDIRQTLREHQLEQQALVNNQQIEPMFTQVDNHIKPDIKPTVPETTPEIELEKTQRSVVAQQGDSAIKIAQKLDPENPNQALGHLYQSGQIKDIKLKEEYQHVIPNVQPNKEYTYDPTLYTEHEKQQNEKLASQVMNQQTQINEQIDRQLQIKQPQQLNVLASLYENRNPVSNSRYAQNQLELFLKSDQVGHKVSVKDMMALTVSYKNFSLNTWQTPYKLEVPKTDNKANQTNSNKTNSTNTSTADDSKVVQLICRAQQLSEGNESTFMIMRQNMAKRGIPPDVNVVAAERFFTGYREGAKYDVALGFQIAGKYFRESDIANLLREKFGSSGVILGQNGSPASSALFTSKWGHYGVWHKVLGQEIGGNNSPFKCDTDNTNEVPIYYNRKSNQ